MSNKADTVRFATGDVVRYVGKDSRRVGTEQIIHEVSYQGRGRFEYSTTVGAWYDAKNFELVRKADKESFKELDRVLASEGED